MNRLCFVIAVTLVACGGGPSVSSTPIRGEDGESNWIAIRCKDSQMQCRERAGEACPGGYVVRDMRDHEGQESRAFVNGAFGVARSDHTYDGELLVQCKGAPSAAADDSSDHRECLGDESCDTGDYCAFPPKAGAFTKGHCKRRRD